MRDTWWFIDSGYQTPAYNMAMDETLLHWHSDGRIPPVLRFYGWAPAGVSIGFFQGVNGVINVDNAARAGIPLVRRLTGGQAVLHEHELTYSIFVSEDDPKMPKTVKEAYLELSKGLKEGYQRLGISAEFALPADGEKGGSANCFEKPSWYELTIDGKKAAGSAQTRKGGVILQHGSVPLKINEEKLFDLFVYPNEEVKARAKQAFKNRAIAINDYLAEEVGIEEVKQAFYKGFETGLGVHLLPAQLPEALLADVSELVKKYESEEWNYLREREGERVR
ncbi:biotin/lipoate A/B protein ligase family protein [Planomicrobium sp. YIM 101495]|uniref:lipoate--protein ligase family protein n=1 Tax=Planomicrobium sp. YIM 101495 TaxID=2665160 RepID=UPI0012B8861A|nr:biotin/lipoate A/B protein ligase family protein [Planomicrobium sp. YIM 101495]